MLLLEKGPQLLTLPCINATMNISDPEKRPTATELTTHPFAQDELPDTFDFREWYSNACERAAEEAELRASEMNEGSDSSEYTDSSDYDSEDGQGDEDGMEMEEGGDRDGKDEDGNLYSVDTLTRDEEGYDSDRSL